MSCLKLQASFSLNFASVFSVMRDNCSVRFIAETVNDLENETYQSTKFQTFDCSRKISLNLYFDRLLLLKVYKIPAKKY